LVFGSGPGLGGCCEGWCLGAGWRRCARGRAWFRA